MAHLVVCSALVICFALTTSAVNFQRTVVAIARPTWPGQYLFLRGGDIIGTPIPIINNMTVKDSRSVYAQTSRGDNYLNWVGREPNQGSYINRHGLEIPAEGTPMIWTTNDRSKRANVGRDGHGFTELNYMGEHLWMADVYMDCDKTNDGWFDFKAVLTNIDRSSNGPGMKRTVWESDYIHENMCFIDDTETPTDYMNEQNHHGKCGYFNFVMWSSSVCNANRLDYHLMPFREEWVETDSLERPMQDNIL